MRSASVRTTWQLALHFIYYNFVRIHQTPRTTPAMAANVTDKLSKMSDIVKLVEAAEQEVNDSNYGAGAASKRKGVRS